MENVLITGITGRSGAHFYNAILDNPGIFERCRISVISRNKEKANALLADQTQIKVKYADIDHQEAMARILTEESITTLFHIAGIGHSLDLVKTALHCGVRRFILVHTTGIFSKYRKVGAEYRRIEAAIEQAVRAGGGSLTILRPTMIYGGLDDGNISRFIRWVDVFRVFPVVNGGRFALQPVNRRDLGKAYYQVLINPEATSNRNYTLSGGTVVDLLDILRQMSLFLNKKTAFFSVPSWVAYPLAVLAYGLTLTKIDYREKVQRLVEPRAFSHEEARNDFGYAPMDFFDGLKVEVDEYIRQRHGSK